MCGHRAFRLEAGVTIVSRGEMRDIDKTREQLINDLEKLRHRISELEAFEPGRKQVEETLRESRRKIEKLHEAGRRLETCQSENEAYQLTVEAAGEMLSFSMCALDVVEGNKLVVKATSSQLAPGASRESELGSGALAAKTYRTGKTYVFGGLDERPDAWQTYPGLSSGIGVPVGDIGVFQVVSTEPGAFTEEDARLLELLAGHTAQAVKRIRLQNELKEQAVHDPLTGVYNRYHLKQTLEQEIKRCKRYGRSIAFLMIDINRFKEINDRFGHQTGDKVLQAVASLLLESVRSTDIVVRYGGDEFLIVLPETDGKADVLKQRMMEKMARRNEINELLDFPVTLSIGSAYWSPGSTESVEEVLGRADRRMYEDKRRQTRDDRPR